MKFNSQICTTRDQSERLIALGLKKETADMCYKVITHDFKGNEIKKKDRDYVLCCWYDESSQVCGLEQKKTIPAWSLHRLIEIAPSTINKMLWLTITPYAALYDSVDYIKSFDSKDNLYDNIIDCIEWLINERYFNKEYLA